MDACDRESDVANAWRQSACPYLRAAAAKYFGGVPFVFVAVEAAKMLSRDRLAMAERMVSMLEKSGSSYVQLRATDDGVR